MISAPAVSAFVINSKPQQLYNNQSHKHTADPSAVFLYAANPKHRDAAPGIADPIGDG